MRKRVLLLLEITIGILVFSLLLFLGIDKFKTHINTKPSYTVYFKDVDGLSIGSPVRLVGKQVGNVIRLELLDSEIYVTFRITEKDIIIPDGSIASIQFTGLAGSRSLEILPPKGKSPANKNTIYCEEPIRINSILQVQTTIFENVLDFCRGLYTFFSKNSIDSTQKNLKITSEYIEESNQSMDETLKNISESGSNISKNTKEIKQFIGEQNENLSSAYESFNKLAQDEKLKSNMDKMQETVEKLSASIDTKEADKKVSELTNNLNNVNSKLKSFNNKISKVKNREIEYISDINNSIKQTNENMQGFINFAKKNFKRPVQEKTKSET